MTFISTLLKAAAALFMLVILMLLVQLDLTVFQTVEVLAPGWGWLAFVALLALEAGAVLWLGLAWFARAPRLVLRDDPTEAERQAFARELARRLKKNPHVRAAGIRATDEDFLEKALDVLDARAGEEIRNNAKRVFLGTALSQNGRLDALIMFVSLARMIWRVSGIYNQRPTPAELWSVYSTVSSATFISFSIEALDIPQTITESMNELLPAVTPVMAASSVPLMGPMMQQCTSAVIDGAANCLLAIRAGVVTRSAFRFAALGREEARQQACVREAGTMLAEISRETVGAIVEAFRKQLMDLPASMGQKISETVGTMADSALEKTRGAAQSVARGGTAVAEAVSSGAGAVIGAGQAVAGVVSSGTGAVADALGSGAHAVIHAVGDCAASAEKAVLRGGSAVMESVGSGAGAVAGMVSSGTSTVIGAVSDGAASAGQAVARGGTAVVGAVSSGAGAVIGAGQAVAGAVSSGTGAVADALGSGTKAVLGAVRGILPGNRRREATADERFVLHLALVWSQGRPGWKRRRQLARLCDAEGVSAGLRTLVDRHPDLELLEPQLSFWRGRAEDVLACHRSLELEHGAAAAAWLAELDHRLGLGGSLQGGHEAPASGWKRFWK
ncbi:MAG: DUF697 domain-containing protein [Desulfovibrio piger]|uniref:DUF697 domain-containing protein n=1 Tax=Desulfovibrio piger TaxID=901 RepID=UPI002A7F749A|nr:DUF697 domain-containing protein [Desulfovibrio piger]MDY3880610.1 DUF697 domain-containing protein [Desulfovibrio piger]